MSGRVNAPSTSTGGSSEWKGDPPFTRVGRYHLLRKLAAGGMAELFLAYAEGVGGFRKLVVLKRVLPHLAENAEFVRMLLEEARLAATLSHPNIVSVLDVGEAEGHHFVVMEYVHGRDAHKLLRERARQGGIPLHVALGIVLGTAHGLHHAHRRTDLDGSPLGIVHRDVSPSNVLVGYDGSVKVADFGIAKASALTRNTVSGSLKGKVGYMSPEQCRGEPVDCRSDIFALGILLYELTTHQRVFFGDNDFAVMNKVVEGRWDLPSAMIERYPPELERIIVRALELDPEERHSDAATFAAEVDAFAHARRLRCSAAAIGAWMHELYGSLSMPRVEVREEHGSPTLKLVTGEPITPGRIASSETPAAPSDAVPRRAPSRRLRPAIVLSAVLLAGAAGWWLASTRAPESPLAPPTVPSAADPEPSVSADAKMEPDPHREASAAAPIPAEPEPKLAQDPSGSEPTPPSAEPRVVPETATRPAETRTRSKRPRTKRPRAKKPSSPLFPVGR